jgi:hypothetical protein
MGNVGFDERVHDELCKKGSFVEKYPYSQATMDLKALTKGIVDVTHGQGEVQAFTLPEVNTLSG